MLMRRSIERLLFPCITLFLGALPTYAKNSTSSPAKVNLAPKLKKYSECRSAALSSLKQGSITKEKFSVALERCNERFPAAGHYVRCKKEKVKEFAEFKGKDDDSTTNPCFKIVEKIEYRTNEILPFDVEGGELFFAGIGLNKKQTTSDLEPPNFSCEKLVESSRNRSSLNYILFGNHPRFFAGLTSYTSTDLRRTFGVEKPSKKGSDIDGYGKIYGDPGKSSSTVFFPSGACDFQGPLGRHASGLAAHYLIDTAGNSAVPYFGIIYYKELKKGLTTQDVLHAMTRILGPEFKVIPKNAESNYVAVKGFRERDEEKDPKNLCKSPREHTYVGLVQSLPSKPDTPSFALIANVQNLCEFGDYMSKMKVN